MEAVGAIGSIAGIASFGLQLTQLLQKQVGEIRGAEERVNDLVSEVQATSNNLDKIKCLLLSNDTSAKGQSLNGRFREDLQFLINRCEAIFRNVVNLLAKAGTMALSSVDGFLRPFKKNERSTLDANIKLEIEFIQLSAGDKALWSFRRPKIEQYIADLGRLKMELMLLLLTISLVRTGPTSTEKDSSVSIPLTDDAITLVDEIYYTNQALDATTFHVSEDHDAISFSDHDDDNDAASDMLEKIKTLCLNWPHSFKTDPPTLQLLAEHGVFFEAYAIDVAGTAHEYAKLPLPPRESYEKALDFARSNKRSISDHFAELSFLQQKMLEQTLLKIDSTHKHSPWEPQSGSMVVALESQGLQKRKLALRKVKSFFGLEKLDCRSPCIRITLMRSLRQVDVIVVNEEEKKEQEGELAKKGIAKYHGETAEAATRADAISEAAAPASALPPDKKEPVKLKDAVGRKYSFPFESCRTWEDMSELINEAFKHVEVVGSHVQRGCYDLVDPDGQIILPTLWDATVQPGWSVSQHMWPMPESEAQPEPPSNPDIVQRDEPQAPNHKKKKKTSQAKSHTNSGFESRMLGKTETKSKSKKTRHLLDSSERRLPTDVARIADYKYREADTPSWTDEFQETVAPSDDDKKAVAQYYLRKWTA